MLYEFTHEKGNAMLRVFMLTAGVLLLGACSTATLPFAPEQQPPSGRIYADYFLLADHLRVELDTRGRRLESAYVEAGDGRIVRPSSVEHTIVRDYHRPRVGLGVGVVGGRGGTGIGTGVGVGTGPRPYSYPGHTFLWFDASAIGDLPWRLHVKLLGQPQVLFLLPTPAEVDRGT
jgi:hypothetical protein